MFRLYRFIIHAHNNWLRMNEEYLVCIQVAVYKEY